MYDLNFYNHRYRQLKKKFWRPISLSLHMLLIAKPAIFLDFGRFFKFRQKNYHNDHMIWLIHGRSIYVVIYSAISKNYFLLLFQSLFWKARLLFIDMSRPATLPPRVTNKVRNQWTNQGNITACVILSTHYYLHSSHTLQLQHVTCNNM